MKKKLFATILSAILAVTMMPLSAFASTNEVASGETEGPAYGTHEYWERIYPGHTHVKELAPGTVLAEGTPSQCIFIDSDITIKATQEGESGLIIRGNVTIIIEDDHTLMVEGAGTSSNIGSGAGIEIEKDSCLRIEGTGTVYAKAGDVNCEKQLRTSGNSGNTKDNNDTGKGGKGGDGMGGMGAAIGTKGGNGGLGGKETPGVHDSNMFKDFDGINGQDGQDGQVSKDAGKLKVSGNVKITCLRGVIINDNPIEGKLGNNNCSGLNRKSGLSACGGQGGLGGPGALIGSGGSGGGGGGAGGSAGVVSQNAYPDGGGGGAGGTCGKAAEGGKASEGVSYHTKLPRDERFWFDYDYPASSASDTASSEGTKGGKGAHGNNNPGGNGGNGGNQWASGDPGVCYSTTLESQKEHLKGNGTGCENGIYHVYPANECKAHVVGHSNGKPIIEIKHIPTGEILKENQDYQCIYEETEDGVTITARGIMGESASTLTDESMEQIGEIVVHDNKEVAYTVIYYFQDLTEDTKDVTDTYSKGNERQEKGIVGEKTNVVPEQVEGFTASPVNQQIIKNDGTTIVSVFYKRDHHNLVLHRGNHSAHTEQLEYIYSVPFGASIEKNLPEGYDEAESGYYFKDWLPQIKPETTMGCQDLYYKAQWAQNEQVKYTVKYHTQDLTLDEKQAADSYTITEEKAFTAPAGTEITSVESIYGFKNQEIEKQVVEPDGSTVIDVLCDRIVNNVSFEKDEHSIWPQDKYVVPVCYGALVEKNMPEGCNFESTEQGWRFVGWNPSFNETTRMDLEDLCFKAQCEINSTVKYTVRYYTQDLTNDGKQPADTYSPTVEKTFFATAGSEIETVEGLPGFTTLPFEKQIVAPDGSTEINVACNRIIKFATFEMGEHGKWEKDKIVVPIYFGASVEKNIPKGCDLAEEGWHFVGWDPDINETTTMGTEDQCYTALWMEN